MKMMSKLKGKLLQLYYAALKRLEIWRFKSKNYFRCVKNWVLGWFFREQPDTGAMENAQCVVICTHPDDETIFFSSVLAAQKPFVVCMSHRGNPLRRKEFYDALSQWNVSGIMLNLPDIPGFRGIWRVCAVRALKKIRKSLPHVHTVYTHSSSGESGHPHHYAVSNGASRVFQDRRIITTARRIPDDGHGVLSEAQLRQKYSIIQNCYPSQIKMLETWCPWWQDYLIREHFEE